ncbi:retrovirus-related pol polyprotein from transposon TNT 1-94 [Tanacetum coccineum]
MDSKNYKEGQSMQRPPLFEANCFIYWKNRFETYVKSKDIDIWHIIVYGNYKPTIKNKDTGKEEVISYEKYEESHKKMISKNNEAKMVLYNALPKKKYEIIFMCNTVKDVWNSLIITHQGNKQVKDNKIDLFVQKYEEFVIFDDETIDCAFARFNTIITSLKALDESFSSRNHVRKFLKALPTKWHPNVTAIEESKDLSTLPLDDLIGNLKVHEVVLEKDSEISKSKKEKYKSLALKARKVSSDEEVSCSESDDEEYAMAIKEDKKEKEDRRCFKSSDPNHFISDCPKYSYNDQKAFVVGCWSDSEEDSKKEEIFLMALDNNEVRLKVNLEPNEWIKDSGCLRDMKGNTYLFSTYKAIDGDENGVIPRNKARLVAQGYNQQEGIDFDETYAHVARLESIRILLAYACAHDFKLFQMDVKSAFLNSFINKEVYVAQPPSFVDFERPNHVFKHKKALYGLKQAPKAWYERLNAFILDHMYTMGLVDNTLFTKKKDLHIIIVQIYVDDIIFGSTCQDLCDDFLKIMHDEFEISMIEDSKSIKTPMSSETKLTRDEDRESIEDTKYHGMIGSLLYIMASRPNVMFSVCLCAHFQEDPKTSHLEAMKQALVDYDIKLDDISVLRDNKSAIDLSKNPVLYSHTKRIDILQHFLRDNVQKGNISIEKVSFEDNIADILTKPLKREPFNLLRLGLGLIEPNT